MMKHGDYTRLAGSYSRSRPDYCESVLDALLSLLPSPAAEIDGVDVGAGTGIWTRMLAARGMRSLTAIEPNDAMREQGVLDSAEFAIEWRKGFGADTGLPSKSYDLITTASSFHWIDFEEGAREFARLLRPGGRFAALWNPRLIEANPLLVEIKEYLQSLKPAMKRVSSGRSGLCETLIDRLGDTPYFDDTVYLEGRHVIEMTPERYIGAWKSVNDVQVQLGGNLFREFLEYIEKRIDGMVFIKSTYLTRAWAARRR